MGKDIRLYCGDCLSVMAEMPKNSIDSVITDPPYGLKFMGKDWDHGVPGERFWKEALRVAKPGAILMAFGGTRTFHRLACAIEDAGWVMRDMMMWVYGQGFPKSHDISRAIDKAAGAERKAIGNNPNARPNSGRTGGIMGPALGRVFNTSLTAPATPAARLWDGWGTALKPAWEPIILAMAPLDGTFAQNAQKWGVAGLWIDGCRVAGKWSTWRRKDGSINTGNDAYRPGTSRTEAERNEHPAGRWPANLLLSHSPGCVRVGEKRVKNASGSVAGNEASHTGGENTVCYGEYARVPFSKHADANGLETVGDWRCIEGCAVRMLGEQSGKSRSVQSMRGELVDNRSGNYGRAQGKRIAGSDYQRGHNDTGTAARFFINLPPEQQSRMCYCPKASKKERGEGNVHPTVKPLALMEYLCKLTRMPTGGVVLDPFMGSGTTGVACMRTGHSFIGIEIDEGYFAIAEKRINEARAQLTLGL